MTPSATASVTTKPPGTGVGPGGARNPRRPGAAAPLRGLAGLAGLVVILQVLPHSGLVSADYLPPASEMARALWHLLAEGTFWTECLKSA